MAEGRIPAGGVHGSGVLVERGMRLGDAEVVGRPVDFGDGGVWEAPPDFFRVEWIGGIRAWILRARILRERFEHRWLPVL